MVVVGTVVVVGSGGQCQRLFRALIGGNNFRQVVAVGESWVGSGVEREHGDGKTG